jgi:hypothetical protein
MTAPNEDPMIRTGYYSKALRAIGDALEALEAELVDLRCEGENYIVRATRRQPPKKLLCKDLHKSSVRRLWETLLSSDFGKESCVALDLAYTPRDIERLHNEGQARRQRRGMPDPHSLPGALRAAGAYVDYKAARLLQISRSDDLIIIRSESRSGQLSKEEFTPASLYALFVKLYMKRTGRFPEK